MKILKRVHNCSRSTLSRFKCTPNRRTIRRWNSYTNNRYTLRVPFHIRWLWALYEVGVFSNNTHSQCYIECGGKMHLREGQFEKAHTDFFEAFKNYDESGSLRRSTCLKYFVLANMLMKSDINPFDSQEAKPFKNDPEILAMTQLVRYVVYPSIQQLFWNNF